MSNAKRIHVVLLIVAATILLVDGVWDVAALLGLAPVDATDAGKSTLRVLISAGLEIWLAGYVMSRWRWLVGVGKQDTLDAAAP